MYCGRVTLPVRLLARDDLARAQQKPLQRFGVGGRHLLHMRQPHPRPASILQIARRQKRDFLMASCPLSDSPVVTHVRLLLAFLRSHALAWHVNCPSPQLRACRIG